MLLRYGEAVALLQWYRPAIFAAVAFDALWFVLSGQYCTQTVKLALFLGEGIIEHR